MKKYLNSILEFNTDLEIQDKFFNILTFFGGIISFLMAPISFFVGLNLRTVIIYLFFGLTYFGLYLLGRFKRNYKILAVILIVFTIFLTDPYLWFTNGGASGVVAYFFIYDAVILGVLLHKSRYGLILGFHFIVILLLYAIEYNYPEIISTYANRKAQYINQSFALILMSAFMFFTIKKIIEIYHNKNSAFIEVHGKYITASTKDLLTKIDNRESILNKLKNILDNSYSKNPLSVIMISIDDFNTINNTYSYTFGDEVLATIAKLLEDNLKYGEMIGRISGKEFLIILPEKSPNATRDFASNLREQIENLKWNKKELITTISLGLYSGDKNRSLDNIMKYVNLCLKQAKNDGYNCIRSTYEAN